jgi:hypothetical protein
MYLTTSISFSVNLYLFAQLSMADNLLGIGGDIISIPYMRKRSNGFYFSGRKRML